MGNWKEINKIKEIQVKSETNKVNDEKKWNQDAKNEIIIGYNKEQTQKHNP
jgi:hypothetical protein